MIPALPAGSPWLPLFALLAGLMVGGNLFAIVRLLPRGEARPTLATAILLLGILLMSMGLWFAGIYAVLSPGDASTVSVFIAVNSMMAVVGVWAISLLFRAGTRNLREESVRWPLGFALLIVGNELLMGLTFVLAQVGPAPYAAEGWAGLASAVGDAASSVWFFWAMLATMVGLIAWLPLSRPERTLLFGFAGASAVGPWVVPDPVVGAVGMAVLMAGAFAALSRGLWRRAQPTPRYVWAGLGVASGFLAMVGAEALTYSLRGSPWTSVPFGLVSLIVMLVEFTLLARWGLARGGIVVRPPVPDPSGAQAPASASSLPP